MALDGARFPLVGRSCDPDRLRRARMTARLSQPELGRRAGISASWVKMLEAKTSDGSARHQPTVFVAEALAEALGCDLDDICPVDPVDSTANDAA